MAEFLDILIDRDVYEKLHSQDSGKMHEEVSAEVERLRRSYIDRAQRRIDKYRENEQQYLDDMLREIDEKTEDEIIRLRDAFSENGEKWIDDIFNSIITG